MDQGVHTFRPFGSMGRVKGTSCQQGHDVWNIVDRCVVRREVQLQACLEKVHLVCSARRNFLNSTQDPRPLPCRVATRVGRQRTHLLYPWPRATTTYDIEDCR